MLQPNCKEVVVGMEDRRHGYFVQMNMIVGSPATPWATANINYRSSVDGDGSRDWKAVLPDNESNYGAKSIKRVKDSTCV
jgi:hypothetical protein